MSIERGDIILFKQPHAWYEKLICAATHGPYYHCAIALDSTSIIEALGSGIVMSRSPINPATFDLIDMSQYEDEANIDRGLEWAQKQVGKIKYGWLDIAFQVVKFVAPNNPFQLVRHDRWDCSNFVTRCIQEMEYLLPEAFSDPYQNTPNDLGRVFSLIPLRKAVLV